MWCNDLTNLGDRNVCSVPSIDLQVDVDIKTSPGHGKVPNDGTFIFPPPGGLLFKQTNKDLLLL